MGYQPWDTILGQKWAVPNFLLWLPVDNSKETQNCLGRGNIAGIGAHSCMTTPKGKIHFEE